MNFNPDLTGIIVAWIGGIAAVQGLTEHVKSLWKNADPRLAKILNYAASILVSLTVVAVFLILTDGFSFRSLFLYAIPIWLTASGMYDAFHTQKTR